MNHIKQIRNQIRNIVKEILPDVIKEELYKALSLQITEQMDAFKKDVVVRLDAMDQRAKDLQNYALRQNASIQPKGNKQ